MAAHARQHRMHNRRNNRIQRVFRDRSNPIEDLNAEEVFDRFRFRPDSIVFLMDLLDLDHVTLRNVALPPLLQLLTCLRFLATGAIHNLIGDSLGISRATTGTCIRNVAEQLADLAKTFIKFPVGEATKTTIAAFSKIAGFPSVVGCIDGTFIRIQRPHENEADFVTRKGYLALNVQMCCDAHFKITSCSAQWPGSVHDSRMFRQSGLCRKFESGEYTGLLLGDSGLLLGDSGYPCRWFLMTPVLRPANPAEERYNNSICRTRVLIEQTFGILKRRFQCLHNELRTCPERAATYVMACAVLHNISIDRGELNIQLDDPEPADHVPAEAEYDPLHGGGRNDGVDTRNRLIRNIFNM